MSVFRVCVCVCVLRGSSSSLPWVPSLVSFIDSSRNIILQFCAPSVHVSCIHPSIYLTPPTRPSKPSTNPPIHPPIYPPTHPSILKQSSIHQSIIPPRRPLIRRCTHAWRCWVQDLARTRWSGPQLQLQSSVDTSNTRLAPSTSEHELRWLVLTLQTFRCASATVLNSWLSRKNATCNRIARIHQ